MGIRFACHGCGKSLNIKQDLAGKRGVCPSCSIKFRIPLEDAPQSSPLVDSSAKQLPASRERASAINASLAPNGSSESLKGSSSGSNSSVATAQAAQAAQPAQVSQATPADLLMDDPEATWYVRPPSGGQYGPATSDVLRQWIDEGRVAASALLWRDGWPQWRAASETLPGLATRFPGAGTGGDSGTASPSKSVVAANGHATTPSNAPEVVRSVTPDAASQVPSPIPATAEPPSLSGRAEVGTVRRERNGRRIMMIVLLAFIALALLGTLVYLMVRP
ncbi:hypothetical protein Pla22_23780 [Rubripirellula amarantea]|uniref:GYF domain-containing protein n=1 Tax=Rubripirellula amarantea TaxID=2527999 RepID=A0A5C5WVM1_9BACT|nr:DUF4339 domain-containing protein [Rubripirellula amarantea]TWT54726.1 hypothetical protein Pla22_23780 [Rubripirellula amarantea]